MQVGHEASVFGSQVRSIIRLSGIWLKSAILYWESPTWSSALALLVYMLFALGQGDVWHVSRYPFYNYLADAFLHGQLALRLIPPDTHDLSLFNGHLYLYWGPLPAIVLMPLVALFGVQVSDIIPTLVIAALNVMLVACVLRQACRRRVIDLSAVQRGLLVLFFALGTVHLTLAPYGRVWFTGQLVGFLCVAMAYLAALTLRGTAAFAATGCGIAAALLARNHLVFAGLWPGCYLLSEQGFAKPARLAGRVLAGMVPVLVAVAALGLYNRLRFGSIFDAGLAYHQMAEIFVQDYRRYGAFNLHYVPTNLFYQYVAYPFPFRPTSPFGGSLFLLSPPFFGALWAIRIGRPRWSVWALVATILLVAAPILLLMGTGWVQFGPRYTLDFTLPLLLLTALGISRWPNRLVAVLTAIAIVQYVIGTIYLGRFM